MADSGLWLIARASSSSRGTRIRTSTSISYGIRMKRAAVARRRACTPIVLTADARP